MPGDVSVVGFDGLSMGQWLSPTLATVAQPHRRIGTDAATALARRIAGEVVPAITLPHRLLAGGTLAAMLPVLDGHATWREIGSDTAELLLRALGVEAEEARRLARGDLPAMVVG